MSFDAEHWTELQSLFHLAESTPAEERASVLAAACSNPLVLQRALDLLAAASREDPPTRELPLQTLGPYKLIRHLGTGGAGAVYLAERLAGSVIQRSAVKVLAPHAAGPGFAERFDREGRILGALEHPNIVRLVDAGVAETGQPYLVMEYVNGVHLDVYCDRERLGPEARLRLFQEVCAGVDYAHRNLTVHLDLKPSNILVTPTGAVKLLDFGTSKLLQSDGRMTSTVMATPAYASPEQLRNEAVTTACDIYSLGVVLFELLTGKRPGGKGSPELTGDLSTIVLKCLMPSPEDRYASVRALSDDIARYLEGRPILARPQTVLYQVGKFVARNRAPVGLAALLALALAGSLYSAWQGQSRAVKEAQRALRMQTFLYRLFQTANSNYTGKPAATVAEFLQLGVKVLPEYVKDQADLRQAQLALAESMFQNRDFQGAAPVFQQVIDSAKAAGDFAAEAEAETFACTILCQQGQSARGLPLCASAVALSSKSGVPPHTRALAAVQYATNREDNSIRDDENLRLASEAIRISREGQLPPHEIALALATLAAFHQQRGAMEKAEPLFQEALVFYQRDPLALCEQGDIYYGLGGIRQRTNRQAEAPALFERAYDTYRTCSGAEDRETLRMGAYYAGALIEAGRAAEAVTLLEAALPVWERVQAGNAFGLREILHFLDLGYLETGRYAEAERIARRELRIYEESKTPRSERMVGYAEFLLARALRGQGKAKEAQPHAEFAAANLAAGAVSPGAKRLLREAQSLAELGHSRSVPMLPRPSSQAARP